VVSVNSDFFQEYTMIEQVARNKSSILLQIQR
jgi:hypothetical protein